MNEDKIFRTYITKVKRHFNVSPLSSTWTKKKKKDMLRKLIAIYPVQFIKLEIDALIKSIY